MSVPEHPRAFLLAFRSGEALVECPTCHTRLRVPGILRSSPRTPRPRAEVPQKTIRFQGEEGRELAHRIEDRARLERSTISRLCTRLLRLGFEADPHIRPGSAR
jgi:hypothetical protein